MVVSQLSYHPLRAWHVSYNTSTPCQDRLSSGMFLTSTSAPTCSSALLASQSPITTLVVHRSNVLLGILIVPKPTCTLLTTKLLMAVLSVRGWCSKLGYDQSESLLSIPRCLYVSFSWTEEYASLFNFPFSISCFRIDWLGGVWGFFLFMFYTASSRPKHTRYAFIVITFFFSLFYIFFLILSCFLSDFSL